MCRSLFKFFLAASRSEVRAPASPIFSATILYMGSGRGQTRRVQVIAKPPNVAADELAWQEFVENGKMEDVTLYQYYILRDGKDLTSWRSTEPVSLIIASELFEDMVAVGALTLPDGYDVEDFGFELAKQEPSFLGTYVEISCKKKPGVSTPLFSPDYYFSQSSRMGGETTIVLVELFELGLRDLLC